MNRRMDERGRYTLPIPAKYKELWSNWEIRVFVLGSLLLQVFLILLASSRKRKVARRMRFFIWSCYLLADSVATFALGHLADNQSSSNKQQTTGSSSLARSSSHRGGGGGGGAVIAGGGGKGNFNSDLLAFWAPFLLLHLGGPDTITAFSLEDNELWLRHLLGLGFQLFAVMYILFRSLPHNSLLISTLLMLFVGIAKYIERTRSLYLGSADGFRDSMLTAPDPGPNYAKLMEEYDYKIKAGFEAEIEIVQEKELKFGATSDEAVELGIREDVSDTDAVLHAHKFFKTFKCLIVDLVLSFQERKESRQFFLRRKAEEAFKVIEVELNFLYDVLYTKAAVVHNRKGYVLRLVCSAAILATFLMFFFSKKHSFNSADVGITYTLLAGAISLDVLALLMLVFSDWTMVFLKDNTLGLHLAPVVARVKKQRWSRKISQLNLISYSLNQPLPGKSRCWLRRYMNSLGKIAEKLCFQDMLDELIYSWRENVDDKLRDFIFEELRLKSEEATDLKKTKMLCECKGAHVLDKNKVVKKREGEDALRQSVEAEFDESLLLWHIATYLCYHNSGGGGGAEGGGGAADGAGGTEVADGAGGGESYDLYRKLSKHLSDYMLYLLVMQPALMSTMAGIGLIRYRDTCAEAKRFFSRGEPGLNQKDACKMLLSVNTKAKPADVKGDRSKSVLFDACILAKQLMELEVEDEKSSDNTATSSSDPNPQPTITEKKVVKLEAERRWKVIAEVWVELLSYAACHCRGISHAKQLSRGGELLTLVWFLMAHLGLGEQYRTEAGQARAKLVAEK